MAWGWALLLKPLIGIAILALMYFGARYGAWLLYHLMPNCRAKRWLFSDWESERARAATKARQRVLNDAPLIRGELGDD